MKDIVELIQTDAWPAAIDSSLICNNNDIQQKKERAEAIVDIMLGDYIENLKILDFGTGEGYTCEALKNKKASKVVGYDIRNNFAKIDGVLLTDNWDWVESQGPYDLILAYDVLDHIEKITSMEALYLMKNVLAEGGQIFLRYHPWIGRHGGHLYEKYNKAFFHTVFSETELDMLVPRTERMHTHKIINTEAFYRSIAFHTGFSILDENVHRKEIESFFKDNNLLDRLAKNTYHKEFDENNHNIEFIDHVLTY